MLGCFRHGCLRQWLKTFEESEGGIDKFTKGYEEFGIHIKADNSVVAREWAPGAVGLYLTGDFSKSSFSGKLLALVILRLKF